MDDSIVSFRNVTVHKRGAELLRDITFELAPRSLTFVTGANGAGKSTLLRLCHGREVISRGEARVFGCNFQTAPEDAQHAVRRRIGLVLEGSRLMDHLSAFDNVALPLRLAGYRRSRYTKDVEELVTWVGLGDKMHTNAAVLSAGERQRIAIARAIVGKPDLLLADDPTAALDDEATDRVMRLLLNIHHVGTTVVVATSNRKLAAVSGAGEIWLSCGSLAPAETAA